MPVVIERLLVLPHSDADEEYLSRVVVRKV